MFGYIQNLPVVENCLCNWKTVNIFFLSFVLWHTAYCYGLCKTGQVISSFRSAAPL